jgi:hypothetical protein
MPSIFTPTPSETERKEPGIGGKPPVDRRPTGGGGGGGDDEWKNERPGPRELLHRVRFFVLSALAADMLFFAVLVLFFFARQAGMRMDPRTHEFIGDWRPILLPPILYLNTALLILSSLTIERARHNIFREIDVLEDWFGAAVSGWAGDGVEAAFGAGICIQSVVDAGELLFLHDYRAARSSPDSGRAGVDHVPVHAGLVQAGGVPADCGGRDGVVLAHDERGVAGSAGGAGAGPVG